MVLNNIKTRQKNSGFTIVELLVVIVVIGILAAITIVSYTGITSRARGSKAISNADSVVSVANIYSTDPANTGFPTLAQLTGYTTMSKIPAGVNVSTYALAVGTDKAVNTALSGATNHENIIFYSQLTTGTATNGACIGYWDFAATSATMVYKYVGTASSGALNQAAPTCT